MEQKHVTIELKTGIWDQFSNLFQRYRNIIQAGAVITDQGLCSVVNFTTGVLVARACSKSEFGIFILCLTILRFMTGLQNSLISIPYTIQYPRYDYNTARSFFGSTLLHQVFLCIIASLGFFSAAQVASWRNADEAIVSTLFMLSIASTAFMSREFIRLVMLAELRTWLNLSMSLIANITTMVAIYYIYKTGNLNSTNAFAIIALCSGLPALAVIGLFFPKMSFIAKRVLTDFKENFKLGKWLTARSFANMGAVSIYPIALVSFTGTAEAGIYGACFQLASLLNPVFMGLNSFLRPKFSHLTVNNPIAVRSITLKISVILTVFLSILFLFMYLAGDLLMIKLYGQDYQGHQTILLICILAVSAAVISGPLSVSIDASKNTQITFNGRMLGAFFSLTIGLTCVWKYGVLGAALGLLASHTISCTYWFIYILRNKPKQ